MGGYKTFTAKEAWELVQSSIYDEVDEILNKIVDAARNKETKLVINGTLSKPVVRELTNRKFHVSNYYDSETGDTFVISW